jgi:hypothetical protein
LPPPGAGATPPLPKRLANRARGSYSGYRICCGLTYEIERPMIFECRFTSPARQTPTSSDRRGLPAATLSAIIWSSDGPRGTLFVPGRYPVRMACAGKLCEFVGTPGGSLMSVPLTTVTYGL